MKIQGAIMGFFSAIKNRYKKSEAAVVAQNLLELQSKICFYDKDPAEVANILISNVWDKMPNVFEGKYGRRPHKINIAALAFANKLKDMPIDHEDFCVFQLCLAKIVSAWETNDGVYLQTDSDKLIQKSAVDIFVLKAEEFEKKNESFLDGLCEEPHTVESPIHSKDTSFHGVLYMKQQNYESFDAWMNEVKKAAAEENKSLLPKSGLEGLSLIDFLDEGTFKDAYDDMVDPISYGRHFGRTFNPLDVGFE